MAHSLYIHIPYCLSKCAYCDFFSVPVPECVPEEYVDALIKEIHFRLLKNLPDRLYTVYVGGGTPSLLSQNQLKRLSDAIVPFLDTNEQIEWTIEVNPDDVDEKMLSVYEKCGINRLSAGIQAFDDHVLSFVHRRSSLKCVKDFCSLVKTYWKKNLSFDLISALPCQSEKSFMEGLAFAVLQKPSHISLYSLTIEEESALGKDFQNGLIDYDFDKADKMWLSGRDFLLENGYVQYEISNFFLKEKGSPSFHNISYWTFKDYIGAGSGASSSFYDVKNDLKNAFRWTNSTDISKYSSYWNSFSLENSCVDIFSFPGHLENLDRETLMFEFFMMGLRLLDGVCLSDFESIFKTSVPHKILLVAEKWISTGKAIFYTKKSKKYFCLTQTGILFLNEFLREIL